MHSGEADADARRWVKGIAAVGVVGVVWYVGSWLVAGVLIDGLDPLHDSISATFSVGTPMLPLRIMQVALVGTGLLMVVFAVVLARGLPGRGDGGPVAVTVSGVATAVLPALPCAVPDPVSGVGGCGASHVTVAAVSYLAIVAAPLLVAHRVRGHAPGLARWSRVLGTIALVGFAGRYLGIVEPLPGLQQRVFNTVADAWLAVVAVWLMRHGALPDGRRPSLHAPR